MRKVQEQARLLVAEAAAATAGARNEASLRHELEKSLEARCAALGLAWTPFTLDLSLKNGSGRARFADVAHGAVVIEYEPPRSFGGREGAKLEHARAQAVEYAELLQIEEGRPLDRYVMVAWDGAHVSFGRFASGAARWEKLVPFDAAAAERLLDGLARDGTPLVHPALLSSLVGPESEIGARLLPALFRAVVAAEGRRTKLLFAEWRRLFGQVVGDEARQLTRLLERQGEAHGEPYATHPAAYFFALNTHIALVAKIVAALSLPGAGQDLADTSVPLRQRIEALESGRLFEGAGVIDMLVGDFFSWYRDRECWSELAPAVAALLARLGTVSFDVTRKSRESTRDLFKGMYETFVPRAIRHALGEFYTPDWLAGRALDLVGWTPDAPLLDPTCGSGTFLLEALRRRLAAAPARARARELLRGLYGIDLNPLAVLAARASLVVFLSPHLDPDDPVRLPVFLADAVNPAVAEGDRYRHLVQTELGPVMFQAPKAFVESEDFFERFGRIRQLVETGWDTAKILAALKLPAEERRALEPTVAALVDLRARGWDGVWSAILADRFAAGAIPRVKFVIGNPPWVKWSHLPPEYASFIKPRCLDLGVFSQDRWVGGIESDISTVITYAAVEHWLAPGGTLGFFITGSVFANESSQGFRRFRLERGGLSLKVRFVEDYADLAPFDGVTNHPTFLVVERDAETVYPVSYRFVDRDEDGVVSVREVSAIPVPGTDAGPWLKGTPREQALWRRLFRQGEEPAAYRGRKGITTDLNGVFFVEVVEGAVRGRAGKVTVRNDPSLGDTRGLPTVTHAVEREHVFPLLRGRGIAPFRATPDPERRVLVPQRGMHGDPELPATAPATWAFLRNFERFLEKRGSYRRFQKGKPFWSIWSTGPYTFKPYKVLWREMPGGRFAAAYIGPMRDPLVGEKPVVPDHKAYFVPLDDEREAAYLTAVLNAPTIARAISAYAAQLSLGVSVVEYVDVPLFDATDAAHTALADLGVALTRSGREPTRDDERDLDRLALSLFDRTVESRKSKVERVAQPRTPVSTFDL